MRNLNAAEKKVLGMIIDDLKNDCDAMEGRPFTGRVVAEAFGTLMATTAALAKIVQAISDEPSRDLAHKTTPRAAEVEAENEHRNMDETMRRLTETDR